MKRQESRQNEKKMDGVVREHPGMGNASSTIHPLIKFGTGPAVLSLPTGKEYRIYVIVMDFATSGPVFDDFRDEIARMKGKATAHIISAAVWFEVTEVCLCIDGDQGQEKSE